jgi:Fe-S cluster assembly iron-binding protein IscA
MALDESNENDTVFENDGLTFIIEKKLLEDAQTIEIDYLVTDQGEGFSINSGLKKSADCGGCTSC